ncbi:MAG TPA: hypothetical protein VFL62_07555 [Bradyrhizobium sp.]|uniref:hypothetical protein n=1 Tax=Bradyrhizobium sp. TaxID=376 RepID=UPI002D7EAE4F|nr:hypothetical protein [Bradyrhizobium sp.]HET7886065.1 hypothetical protein [Bradyrhizobium sp.]
MLRIAYLTLPLVCAVIAGSVLSPVHANHLLISEEEAKLPPPKGAVAADRRGITRGPKIEVVGDKEQSHSPVHLQLKFESFGGARIDPQSLKVTYLRTPNVDLTERVKSFAGASGLDIPDAELPPGDHMIRVDIKDSDGRTGSTSFVLKISP